MVSGIYEVKMPGEQPGGVSSKELDEWIRYERNESRTAIQHVFCRLSHMDFPGRNHRLRWSRGLRAEPRGTGGHHQTYLKCKKDSH